jgi:diguanylate cyclase (GGDEF)-like protein/PAS domain S-box-containing protein
VNDRSGAPDGDPVAAAYERLLADHPDARVAAVNYQGIYQDLPDTVPRQGHDELKDRAFDMVGGGDRVRMFDAWRLTRQNGSAAVDVTLLTGEPATFFFLDTRAAYDVLLVVLVPDESLVDELADLTVDAPARSRFGRYWRNDVARVVRMDTAAGQLLGFDLEGIRGREAVDFIHPDDHSNGYDNWLETISAPGAATRWRGRHLHAEGHYLWIEFTNTYLPEGLEAGTVLSEMMDVSEEMAANERLREREELLQRLAESLPTGIVQIDLRGLVVFTNSRLHQIVGTGPMPTLLEQFATTEPDDRRKLASAVDRVIGSGADVDLDLRLEARGDAQAQTCRLIIRALHDAGGMVAGAVLTVEDITEATGLRHELEQRANFDPLTSCNNRASTMARLHWLLGQSPSPTAGTGVIFLDLDEFKPINDRLGHAAGDQVLAAAADRLRLAVRGQDLVGRLGGDEFLAVCPGIDRPQLAVVVAERITRLFAEPLMLGDEEVHLKASMGVAWSLNRSTTAERLVARADEAMYEAKRRRDGLPYLALPTIAMEETARGRGARPGRVLG